jgi:WhiB family redox-sensing transcriptional regulator
MTLLPIIAREEWIDAAECLAYDPDTFFPETGQGDLVREAKRICGWCEVSDQCLDYAIKHRIWVGVWGGLTERERRKVKAQRRGQERVARETG